MAKTRKPRKTINKTSHLRRSFIGARIEFDGNEDHGQIAEFANGRLFNERDIHFIVKNAFIWIIDVTFEFRNELGFSRFDTQNFKTSPCRFNELSDYANELGVKAGLGMPDGYRFYKNTWKAKVIG